jgi:hypothetical protein
MKVMRACCSYLLLSLLLGQARSMLVYPAPIIRVNATAPKIVIINWKQTEGMKKKNSNYKYIEIQGSEENNFLPSNTMTIRTLAPREYVTMEMSQSTYEKYYFYRIRPIQSLNASKNDNNLFSKWSPTNKQWKISNECDDYLSVGNNQDPSKWKCQDCPEGASCEYALTDHDIKAKFSYQRITKNSGSDGNDDMNLQDSFHRCRVKIACLGLRMREFAPNVYSGKLLINGTELGPTVDLARTNVNPRCNYGKLDLKIKMKIVFVKN